MTRGRPETAIITRQEAVILNEWLPIWIETSNLSRDETAAMTALADHLTRFCAGEATT